MTRGGVEEMNLADFLIETTASRPDHTALIFEGKKLSFLEMDREVDALVRGLGRLGLGLGDRCVLMMPNSIEWVLVYYALARLGAVVVPVNFIYRKGELQHIFSDSGAKAFIGHSDYLAEALPVVESLPAMSIRVVNGMEVPAGCTPLAGLFDHERSSVTYAATAAGDPFAIIYTSGTTGLPKGAVLTHGNLMGDVLAVSGLRTTEPGDVVLSALPLFHIYGQTHALNLSIFSGLTLRLWDHFDPAEMMAAIEEEESTILYAVPTMINRLVELASASPPRTLQPALLRLRRRLAPRGGLQALREPLRYLDHGGLRPHGMLSHLPREPARPYAHRLHRFPGAGVPGPCGRRC